jgi:AcrR family transcriptional regulator
MVNVIKEHKEGVRSKILKAAMRLFVKHGIRAVKMDDVAAELQMSKRTLYEIYNNKEDLLVEGVLKSFEQGDLEIQKFANDGHNVLEVIVEACRQKISFYNSANPLFLRMLPNMRNCIRPLKKPKRKIIRAFWNSCNMA